MSIGELVMVLLISVGCARGQIRLVGGFDLTEGRVEICLNKEWGTVCDQTWDVMDGSVVCRQLGLVSIGRLKMFQAVDHIFNSFFFVGVEAPGQATFGQGVGRIWLDNIQCAGNERELTHCIANSSGINSCTHAEDAGVRCGNISTLSAIWFLKINRWKL